MEYNGGFGQYAPGAAFQIEDSWLAGIEYSWNAADFSRGFTLQALYKYIKGKHNASFQVTGVWYLNFAGDKLSFNGFADFWREDWLFSQGTPGAQKTRYIFQAEPQLWYNFTGNFALGSEAEVDYNFGGMKGFKIMPTIGAKVTF